MIPFQREEEKKENLSFLDAGVRGEGEIVSKEERTDKKKFSSIPTKLISRT